MEEVESLGVLPELRDVLPGRCRAQDVVDYEACQSQSKPVQGERG